VEKWLLESYNLYEINFTTAALFMILTALQELLKRGSLQRIKPVSWKILLLISLFTLGAWHCFLSALSGLSVFEFGAMSLLSPVVMAALAMVILRERPSPWIWPAIGLGMAGGWLMVNVEWQGWSSGYYHAFMILPCIHARSIVILFAALDHRQVCWRERPCFGHDFLGTNYGVAGDGIYYRSRWLVEQNDPHALQFCGIAVSLTSVPRPFLPDPSHICHLNLRSDIH